MGGTTVFWHDFWPNFWANFASDFLVGIVLVGLISWIVKKSKNIDAQISAVLIKQNDRNYHLKVALKNTGKISFKSEEVYYHIFVPANTIPVELDDETTKSKLKILDKDYFDFVGLLSRPCFPGRNTDLCTLKVTNPESIKQGELLYFLSTAYGFFPKGVTLSKEGHVEEKSLGRVRLETS